MASATKVKLSTSHRPVFAVSNLTDESANTASVMLQKNHDDYHIYFNADGFHNHIAHHMLTLYALGSPSGVLQSQFNGNAGYQRPRKQADSKLVEDFYDEETFGQHLGGGDEYINYLKFFESEIDKKGWQDVVNEYLFAGTEKADDMLARCFGGFLHPLIHLGFGIEFDQPAIIAEALAQTAVHTAWMGKFLFRAEELAKSNSGQPRKTLIELMEEGRKDTKLVQSARNSDGNKIRDGIIQRAPEEMAQLASQYTVDPSELKARCAEMIEFCAYTSFAAQRPEKEVKVDFFLMHNFNCAVFFPRFLTDASSDWLTPANKARLLEWKGRTDMVQYVARGSPELLIDEIKNYTPKKPAQALNGNGEHASSQDAEWKQIFARAEKLPDDGHLVKLLRTVANGPQYCKGAIENPTVTDDMWLKMGHMAVDSCDGASTYWLRSVGFDEAWEGVPARRKAAL